MHRISAFCLILILSSASIFAQPGDVEKDYEFQISADFLLSRVEGDAPTYLRQSASDVSTNFGTAASYERKWKAGYGLSSRFTKKIIGPIHGEFGLGLSAISLNDKYQVAYDPPRNQLLTLRSMEVSNTFYTFNPSLGLRGKWRTLGLTLGAEAKFFIAGNTKNTFSETLTTGETEEIVYTTRMDTQDQLIFKDAASPTGFADYSNSSPRNHGANPVWFNLFGRLDWKLFDKARSPIIGLSYYIPLSEAIRSQNPKWSLVSTYGPDLEEVNLGTKVSTMGLHIGWVF